MFYTSIYMIKDPVVVIGGGFGGVYTTKTLLKLGYPVILASKTNYFTFTPLLHEVATGSLLTHDIIFEYETFFKNDDFELYRCEVTDIDIKNKKVILNNQEINYSYLVLATGSMTNTHNIKGVENIFELKTAEDAIAIKNKIVSFAQCKKIVEVNVIGAGATGSELVFDIDRLFVALQNKHPTLKYKIRVINARNVMGGMDHPTVQSYIKNLTDKYNIEVLNETIADEVTCSSVKTNKGEYESDITILCAGVKPNTGLYKDILNLDDYGSVKVNEHLQIVDNVNIFALGDIISINGKPVPKLAQTAVREAEVVAKNISLLEKGKDMVTYQPRTFGFLLSLGYGNGIGQIFGFHIKGLFAWYVWRTVYLFKTPGIINKLRVAFSWTIHLFQGRNLTEL